MKVIEDSTNSKFPYRTKCIHCRSVLEVDKEDLELVDDWRDGNFYQFNCPVCKNNNGIAESILGNIGLK